MEEQVKFGTDGWRGIIADDFTFDNVRRVGNAIATYVHKNEDATKGLVVGYDTRFGSQQFRAGHLGGAGGCGDSRFGCRMTTRPLRRSRTR